MILNNPKAGMHHAGEYQSSGLPWVRTIGATTDALLVEFPKATRAFTIRNLDDSNAVRIGFTENGVIGNPDENYFELPAGGTERFEIRCKQLYLQGQVATVSASLMVELTTIDAIQFPILSGSVIAGAGSEWPGVG